MPSPLRDVFASLNSHQVRYVVIGGTAAVLHGVPRATFDLDILIEATLANAERLLGALREAEFGTALLINSAELLKHEITIFRDRYRIDVQTSTPGLQFEDAWKRRVEMFFGNESFWVVSKRDLVASKKAAGRKVDLEDVRLLELSDSADLASE
jgi:hypothetical protein